MKEEMVQDSTLCTICYLTPSTDHLYPYDSMCLHNSVSLLQSLECIMSTVSAFDQHHLW